MRVLFPPLRDPQHVSQPCAHLLHLRAPFPFGLLGFHPFASLLGFFSCILPPPCLVQKNETHPVVKGYLTSLRAEDYTIYNDKKGQGRAYFRRASLFLSGKGLLRCSSIVIRILIPPASKLTVNMLFKPL